MCAETSLKPHLAEPVSEVSEAAALAYQVHGARRRRVIEVVRDVVQGVLHFD